MNRLLRFDGRVAVVTGAGGGIGKAYALLLAERGASVVVNDLGGSTDGEGGNTRPADEVVNLIKNKGGKAVANYDSVTNGTKIIETAMDGFGRVDILINNAGILRDKSFVKMTPIDWEKIQQVHLEGAFSTTRAVWNYFRNQNYGRVIMTSSSSGLLGNFGQANYAAAKAGLVGFAQSLAKEGIKFNIHTNTIVPVAGSRMTESVMPPDLYSALKPDLIAPVVSWLCHENCTDNGSIIETCAGFATKYKWFRGHGAFIRSRLDENVTIEVVREKWPQVTDMDRLKGDMPTTNEEMTAPYLRALEKMSSKTPSTSEKLSRANLMDYDIPTEEFKYDSKDTILYALGVGMSITDPNSLNYLYEHSEDFRVLPTYPVIVGIKSIENIIKLPELNIDYSKMLHGEQYVEIYRPLPPQGTISLKTKIVDVLDKITGTLFIATVEGEDKDGPLFKLENSTFEVGSGKFGGNRVSKKPITQPIPPPKRNPDRVFEFKTSESQAALYRLSGDRNPLHIDPTVSAMVGFPRPILHGLCSFGIATQIILQNFANGDPKLFKATKVRFSKPVLPGDILLVETWIEENRVHFEVRIKGSNELVLSGGYVDLAKIYLPANTASTQPL